MQCLQAGVSFTRAIDAHRSPVPERRLEIRVVTANEEPVDQKRGPRWPVGSLRRARVRGNHRENRRPVKPVDRNCTNQQKTV